MSNAGLDRQCDLSVELPFLDMTKAFVTASIVVEWYNATRAKRNRSQKTLAALAAQVQEISSDPARFAFALTRPIEVVVTYNADALQHDQVARAVYGCLPPDGPCAVRLAPVPGGTYCVQKNHGAAVSSGEVVIFLDSDVNPERGWLAAMLGAFRDSNVSAAIGNTYVDYSDGEVYSKAMALTWMFPLRSQTDGLERAKTFYANNVAFRKHVFQEGPFQDVPGFIHAAARQFVSRLEHDQIILWSVGDARASHPPPNGLMHFVQRAVAGGRARALSPTSQGSKGFWAWVASDLQAIAYHAKILLRDRRAVGLTWLEIPVAMTVSTSYDVLLFTGSVMSKLFPRWMFRHFDL